MKSSLLRARRASSGGFTLVELLVVIGIIAILASVLVVSAGAAISAAKRTKVGNMITQIQTAVVNYNTEYNVYPVPTGTATSNDYLVTDAVASAGPWTNIIYALCGNINPITSTANLGAPTVPNTRSIVFLNMKRSDVFDSSINTSQLICAPINPLRPQDTQPYINMAIDQNYDNVVGAGTGTVSMPNFATATTTAAPPTSGGTSTAGVALWANCIGNTTTFNPAFWVRTY